MSEPRVSVIVPVYNTEAYLGRCLRSLARQTLKDLEIVAIDDGSTDGSPKILQDFAKRFPGRFTLIRQENRGQAAARNRGLEAARGSYIGFLDSDDFVRPDMFRKMLEAAEESGADYVACGYTDTLPVVRRRAGAGKGRPADLVLQRYVASRPARRTKDLYFGALVSPFIHLYRREILEESGVRFPEGVIYEDTAFYMNLIPYIRTLAEVPEPLACRTRRADSTTTTITAGRVRNIFPVIDDVLAFYREKGFLESYGREAEYMCVRILACSSLRRAALVRTARERRSLVRETLAYLEDRFPGYRGNPCFRKGLLGLYLRTLSERTARAYVALCRFRGRFGRRFT